MILLTLLVVAAVLWFVYPPAEMTPHPTKKVIVVTGRQISEELTHFLGTLSQRDDFYLSLDCKHKGECELANPDALPTAAWQILGAAGMIQIGDRSAATDRINYYFGKWKERTDLTSELYSIHQLYKAYRVTGNPELFGWFWGRAKDFLSILNASTLGAEGSSDLPSLVATVAGQFAQAAEALGDPKLTAFLKEHEQLPGGDQQIASYKKDFIDTTRHLIGRAEALSRSGGEGQLISGSGITLSGCWAPWARLSLYDATKDEKDLNDVVSFLKSASFATRKHEEVNAELLQVILPCIEMLIQLRSRDQEFEGDYRSLIEGFVLSMWDTARDPLCNGDGGVLGVIKKGAPCEANSKTASDNGWLLYLLSQIADQSFTFEPRMTS